MTSSPAPTPTPPSSPTPSSPTEPPVGSSAASAVAVAVASIAANLITYALLLVSAHVMTEADYGTLSSLFGLLLIAFVPMLALQTVAARRTAAGEGVAGLVHGAAVIGLCTCAGFAVASPLIAVFLHLPSPVGVLLVAGSIVPTAVLGVAMGVAQGRRRFRRLAGLILLTTGGRSLGGLAGLAVRHTTTATLVGVLLGCGCAAVVAVGVVAGGSTQMLSRAVLDRTRTGVVLETAHAGHAHGSFLLLTSLDVLLARHVLSPTAAGVYGVGSVITRAALWLPQSLVTLMFASLAASASHVTTARRATAAIAGIGTIVVAGTATLGPLVITVVGGRKYHSLDHVAWLFALLGAMLALVQLAVLAGLAQRRVGRTALLWVTSAADVAAVLTTRGHDSPTRVVTALALVTGVVACAAVVLTIRRAPGNPAAADRLARR